MSLIRQDTVTRVDHGLAQDILTELRDGTTGQAAFRDGLVRLGRLCGAELVNDRFETKDTRIETPLEPMTAPVINGRETVVLIGILRAATPVVEGLRQIFPGAREGLISASRDEAAGMTDTGQFPITIGYEKFPDLQSEDRVIIADPMLATGSTMTAVLDRVLEAGDPTEIYVVAVVSAPAGLERVTAEYPQVEVITVAVDDRLNDDGFIVPGLGDAGDRAFGTTPSQQ